MTGTRRRLTGRIQVSLPPDEAFRLFTPRGEQEWAAGWEPQFPAPAPDDTEPGTVFETDAHGQHTIWLVLDRHWGTRICYARVTPGGLAGTVTVAVNPAGRHSEVDVTYDLTELGAAAGAAGTGGHELSEFASSYPGYLQSWQDAIAARLRGQPLARRAREVLAHLTGFTTDQVGEHHVSQRQGCSRAALRQVDAAQEDHVRPDAWAWRSLCDSRGDGSRPPAICGARRCSRADR